MAEFTAHDCSRRFRAGYVRSRERCICWIQAIRRDDLPRLAGAVPVELAARVAGILIRLEPDVVPHATNHRNADVPLIPHRGPILERLVDDLQVDVPSAGCVFPGTDV